MVPQTISELIDAVAAAWPDQLACVDGDRRVSYRELRDEVVRAGAALAASGVRKDDTIALWAPNGLEWIVVSFGAAYVGARVVPLNTRYRADEAADILRRSRASMLFTVNGFLGHDYVTSLRSRANELPGLHETVLLRGDGEGAVSLETFMGRGDGLPDAAVAGDDVSHIQYTSGTTGRAKGAMLRHRAMVGTTRDWIANVGLSLGDRYLIVSPFFHISGHKTGVLACVTAGATMYPQPVFDPVAVMQRVQDERITVLPGPPTIYQALLEHPRRHEFDLSSLQLAVTGAASIPAVLIGRMFDELGFDRVISAYGITETTGVVTMCRPDDDRATIAATSGRVVPGVEIKIAPLDDEQSDSGNEAPAGEAAAGEILVRGYNVMRGYLDDPEATSEAIDAEGWFHTGDVGWLDEAGNLRITDRIKDLFIVGGFNVYPAEVEATLLTHPAVAAVAVVGAPDERMGEVGVAFVVARYPIDGDELIEWCRENLANFKAPRRVRFVEALPVNASGKVTKFELRALL
ncbi:MAG: FadD3 family acyl-CoA ligase [Acidimicrobiales bacterium]